MLRLASKPRTLILCILDGWGVAPHGPGNAITQANLPNFNGFWFSYPHTILENSGPAVGLPKGEVGNSEVGHINLGAGRIIFQDLLRINIAISDNTFFENEAFRGAIDHAIQNDSNIHLMGLVGLGSVHSLNEHLFALLKLLQMQKVDPRKVFLHLFTDGRDSPPTSAKIYLSEIIDTIKVGNLGRVATISGRYYAMDRDNRWDRTQKAFLALTGRGSVKNTNALKVIDDSYFNEITDEFIEPTMITSDDGSPVGPITNADSVIFFNFRPDRARQLTKAFVADSLENIKAASGDDVSVFARGPKLNNLFFVTFTEYEAGLPVSATAFKPTRVVFPLSRIFSEDDIHQLHIAETEKYAHVTYFFNGGSELAFPGEDRILVNSQKVASYDQVPQMSAPDITERILTKIDSYDFIVVNYANADMVAHTGNLAATIKAVESVDMQLGVIAKAALSVHGCMIITSDHGNAEEMINPRTGQIETEHTANPSPAIFLIKEFEGKNLQLPRGILADIAPTILSILKIPKPPQMTGRNLLE